MKTGHARSLVPVVAVALALAAPDAFAYLDPSTGSMIISAIVGMFATAALALKTYWYKLKNLFRRPDQKPGAAPGADPGQKPARDTRPAAD